MTHKTYSFVVAVFMASMVFSSSSQGMSKKAYLEKRSAIIVKHSHQDNTFAALQTEKSVSSEYWRWRVDQYLYGQYPEFQPIYDAFTEGKSFEKIYQLPPEDLSSASPKSQTFPSIPAGYFTDNLVGNSKTGWHKLIGNKLYITYQGHLTDPYVASYDLSSHKWDGPYKAGHSTLSKGNRKIDSHGRPIIEVDSQGYVHIVFGGHGGEREDGLNPLSIDTPHAGGRMTHVVSAKPHDLTQFVEKNDITPFASYAKSYKMGNGDIYFFTRGGTHKSPWLYYKMKSGSQTFEPPVKITWPTTRISDPIMVDTHYINPQKVSDTEIVITALWHACNFKEIHDKTHYNRLNAYYMKLDTTTDTFYNIKDETLTLPLTLAATNQHTLAYDSEKTQETSFGTQPLVLEDGTYTVAYEAKGEGYREWRMALFENGSWSHGHPMPGTVNRTLRDTNDNAVNNIQVLEVMGNSSELETAAVIYQDMNRRSIFALANKISQSNSTTQDWKVDKTVLSVAKSKFMMEPVKDESGNTVAIIINVKKGASQRLYLWHANQLRQNPNIH